MKQSADFTLGNSLFGSTKLTKNSDFEKYKYSGFEAQRRFLVFDGSNFGKNVLIFSTDMSWSGHVNNRKRDILILGKAPMQGLDDTTLTAEKEYAINFSEKQKKFF